MKAEDVNLGMKVVPHSKSIGFRMLDQSKNWKRAKDRNQSFLWVVDINTREGCFGLCDINRSESYDRFLAEDFEPYVDENRKKLEEYFKIHLPNGKLLGEHLYGLTQDNDELENMLYRLNQVGSDAFISGLPENSIRYLMADIGIKRLSKTFIKKWEYSISVADLAYTPAELDKFGADGWELCAISGKNYHFKRPCNG